MKESLESKIIPRYLVDAHFWIIESSKIDRSVLLKLFVWKNHEAGFILIKKVLSWDPHSKELAPLCCKISIELWMLTCADKWTTSSINPREIWSWFQSISFEDNNPEF